MQKAQMMYEGKAKKVYATDDDRYVIVSYKDDATAFNGQKKGTIVGKGVVNNKMSNYLMQMLEKNGVKTDYVEELNDRETVLKKVEIVPLEVIVRNKAAGSFSKRLGVAEGTELKCPILEFCYKDDALGDPMVNEYHVLAMGYATREELDTITSMTFRINDLLKEFFAKTGVERLISSWSSAAVTAKSFWRMKFLPIPAASGISKLTRSWTRTVSAGIWAA